MPIIEKPVRPVLPEEPAEWTDREALLLEYAVLLETRIDAFNAEARRHNEEHGYDQPSP